MPTDMKQRKDRRFKQWNKTRIKPLVGPRGSNGHPQLEGFTYDISIGGARIHSAESFEVGALVRLEIELVRTREELRVEGVVKWCRRNEAENVYELGLEFQHTSMVTVLALMKELHDGRRAAPQSKSDSADVSRFGPS